jgi:hypothetical protein
MSLRSLGLSKDLEDAQRQPSCFPDVERFIAVADDVLTAVGRVVPVTTCGRSSFRWYGTHS